MSLRKKQSLFASMLPALINKAIELGYEVTLGDAYRDPRLHGAVGVKQGYGHSKSCHKIRLAIDLNLFNKGGGVFADHRRSPRAWRVLGVYRWDLGRKI